MTVGARVGQVRELAGLSAREMSDLAGLAETHVRLLETGARKTPSIQTIKQIADAFDVSLDWLISGEGEVPSARGIRAAVEVARARKAG